MGRYDMKIAAVIGICLFLGVISQETIKPPEISTSKLWVPSKTLMGPGPSTAHPRVLDAARLPLLGHLHPEFVKIMDDVTAWLKYTFQTKSQYTLAVSGTGHAAMEAAVANFVEPGDVVLVGVNGIWGERMCELVERYSGKVIKMERSAGEVFSKEEIGKELESNSEIKIVFLTHGESSTGTLQPLEGLGELCHDYGALLFVDTVCTLGCIPLNVEEQGIDITYSGSQKCLGAPPGSSPLTVSHLAVQKLKSRSTKPATYYLDLNLLGEYWGFEGNPRWYHHTGMVTNIYTLREALAILANEGLESAWKRHRDNAEKLWSGLEKMGLKLFVKDPKARLPTVTTIEVPDGISWKDVASYMMQKYKIEISGGLGPTAGKVWRVGLMGFNAYEEKVNEILSALQDALDHFHWHPGAHNEL